MRLLLLATLLISTTGTAAVEAWMHHAFYPVLFGILVVASLGLPIPEDIPLIAAGVLLNTHAGIATWPLTLAVAFLGVMAGDLILYMLGRRWGPDVVSHRYVRRLITARQFERASRQFHRFGIWFCFFGRFFMGIRAVMCMTAGATRFPYWRFFLADSLGALISIPGFVYLGYWFADMIPALRRTLTEVQSVVWGVGALAALVMILVYRYRRGRRRRRAAAIFAATQAATSPAAAQAPPGMPATAASTATPLTHGRTGGPPEARVPADVGG